MTGDRPRILAVGRRALLLEATDAAGARRLHAAVQRLVEQGAEGLALPDDVVPAARTVLLDGLDDAAGWRVLLGASGPGGDPRTCCRGEPTGSCGFATTALTWPRPRRPGAARPRTVARAAHVRLLGRRVHGLRTRFRVLRGRPAAAAGAPENEPARSGRRRSSGARRASTPPSTPSRCRAGGRSSGTTDQVMFDPASDQPAYLAPGDAVRFEEAE